MTENRFQDLTFPKPVIPFLGTLFVGYFGASSVVVSVDNKFDRKNERCPFNWWVLGGGGVVHISVVVVEIVWVEEGGGVVGVTDFMALD